MRLIMSIAGQMQEHLVPPYKRVSVRLLSLVSAYCKSAGRFLNLRTASVMRGSTST